MGQQGGTMTATGGTTTRHNDGDWRHDGNGRHDDGQ
jgi:hypothetical protein